MICKNRASDQKIGGAVSLSLVVELSESILRAAYEAAHIFSVQVMRRCDDAEFAVGRRVERENVHVAVDALHDEIGEDRNAELVFYHRDDRGVVHIRVADDGLPLSPPQSAGRIATSSSSRRCVQLSP